MTEEKQKPDTAMSRALDDFKVEQEWYKTEREMLDKVEDDHQIRWKLHMRRLGRL